MKHTYTGTWGSHYASYQSSARLLPQHLQWRRRQQSHKELHKERVKFSHNEKADGLVDHRIRSVVRSPEGIHVCRAHDVVEVDVGELGIVCVCVCACVYICVHICMYGMCV